MDFHNIANLHLLVDELAQRYGGKKGLYVYPRLIIDEKKAWDSRYSMEQWSQLYDEKEKLEKKLAEVGLSALSVQRVSSKLKLTSCQADNDDCLIVTPNGSLGVCEHHSDIGLIGHIDSESRDQAVIDEWRTLFDEIPECDTCFYYPECRRLKNCPHNMPCIAPERKSIRSRMEQAMLNEYRIWKKKVDPVNP
jgi:radical SAM protein with 4Fe4S-binding SPASM domain